MLRFWVLAGALSAGAVAAGAETVVLEAVERGTFRENGSFELGPEAAYAVGRGGAGEERAVFVFDASALEGAAASATLRIWSSAAGFVNAGPVERVAVYAVSGDPAALAWKPWEPPVVFEPRPLNGTFWDLGTGKPLGAARIAVGFEGFVEIPLDRALLRILDRADGLVGLGVRAESPGKRRLQRVFANTGPGSPVPPPQLLVELAAAASPGPDTVLHVDRRLGSRHGPGTADRPFRSLAVALDLATPGDTVLVAPGRYVAAPILKEGVDVRGAGADRTLLDLGDQLPSLRCANATLDGLFVWRDVRSARNPTEAVDCTNAASPTISASRIGAIGVAIRLEGSRAIVTGSEVDGAIVGLDASPVIEESELDGRGGSAVRLSYSTPGAEAVRIERNRIRGALELEGFAPEASMVVGNLFLPTPQLGIPPRAWGGISASAVGDLGLIASNTFLGTQGIALCEFFTPLPPWTGPLPLPSGPCVNREQGATAVIANNVLAFGSRGILLDAASDPSIVHNDVFQNENPFALGPTGNYVGVTNLTGIDGNLSEDPLFEDHEDAVPGAGSPLLDAGTEELAASALDLDGDPRVAAEAIDLGAQERQPGEPAARPIQIFVEGRARTSGFGLGSVLVPKKSFRVSIRSDPDLDAPAEVDIDSLSLEGFAPLGRCRARDADGDGAEDLVCRFPCEAFEGVSGLVTKRFCLLGQTTDGTALRGCARTNVLHLPHATVR